LDRLSDEVFNQMTVLAQQFVDYAIEDEGGIQRGEEIIDVNVELDESEESGAEDEGDEEDKRSDDQGHQEVPLDIEEEDADIHHQAARREEEGGGSLDITEIDAQWLNRTLSGLFDDLMAEEVQELEGRLMKVLALENPRECEKKLFGVLGVDRFELIRLLVRNKAAIYWGTLLQQAQTPAEKESLQ
jgi:pre-mRNA-splicing helicase BRR2